MRHLNMSLMPQWSHFKVKRTALSEKILFQNLRNSIRARAVFEDLRNYLKTRSVQGTIPTSDWTAQFKDAEVNAWKIVF